MRLDALFLPKLLRPLSVGPGHLNPGTKLEDTGTEQGSPLAGAKEIRCRCLMTAGDISTGGRRAASNLYTILLTTLDLTDTFPFAVYLFLSFRDAELALKHHHSPSSKKNMGEKKKKIEG